MDKNNNQDNLNQKEQTKEKSLDEKFTQLQKERACLHLREKFYQQLTKKKLIHLEKNTQKFFYTYLIKNGENKCLCECLNNLRNIKENKYYQLSQNQQIEIKKLKAKIKKLESEKNKVNRELTKIKEILNRLLEQNEYFNQNEASNQNEPKPKLN